MFEIFTSGDIHKQSISYPLRPCKLGITELFRVEKLEDQWENICMIYYPDGKQNANLSFRIMNFFFRVHR